jgi:hypothetical protein
MPPEPVGDPGSFGVNADDPRLKGAQTCSCSSPILMEETAK